MRVLVVHCHPCEESFGAALRDGVLEGLQAGGHDARLLDLYADRFDPVMDADERRGYHTPGANEAPVAAHLARHLIEPLLESLGGGERIQTLAAE